MSDISYPPLDVAGLAAMLIADASPSADATNPAAGSMAKAQGAGHQHPRPTSVTYATVTTGATVTVPFTRFFTNKPGVVCTEIEGDTTATAQPAIFKVQSWIQDASNFYTGCVVRVWRSQTVPTNLVTLLLGGVFNLFQTSVVGTNFSAVAIARSDVPA